MCVPVSKQCACAILSSVVPLAQEFYSTSSHKRKDFKEEKKNNFGHKMCVLILCINFIRNIFILRRNERDTIKNVY